MNKAARDRTQAKRIVEQQKTADRRRRVTRWTTIGVVVVLVAAGLIGWGVIAGQNKDTVRTPSVAVDEGTAFAVGTGPVTVDLYEDFMCPICHEFETQAGTTIQQLVSENKVTVRYHPVAILDGYSSGTEYSTRAAGAVAAAAQDGKFLAYHDVLYRNQPAENSTGLTNAKLIELGKSVGLTSSTFADAVNGKTYSGWAGKVTDTVSARGFIGTPTVLVAGKPLTGDRGGVPTAAQLSSAVAAAAG
jgi:protein-disulfide isomerase